jgi:membrane-associated phospholipid phosphatase
MLTAGQTKRARFAHLPWILVFPVYLISYFAVEAIVPTTDYWVSYIPLDDHIPFVEQYVIFYVMWYAMLAITGLYLLFFNADGFKKYCAFIGIGFFTVLIFSLFFPNGQDLRPPLELIQGKNPVDWWLRFLYGYDTNTNVMPSIHVIGTLAASFGLLQLKGSRKWWSLSIIAVFTVSICLSIVFIKQHSLVDLFAALALCAVSYPIIYNKRTKEIAQSSSILPIKFKK